MKWMLGCLALLAGCNEEMVTELDPGVACFDSIADNGLLRIEITSDCISTSAEEPIFLCEIQRNGTTLRVSSELTYYLPTRSDDACKYVTAHCAVDRLDDGVFYLVTYAGGEAGVSGGDDELPIEEVCIPD